jgi:MYXO-CTERM domain-containing protein
MRKVVLALAVAVVMFSVAPARAFCPPPVSTDPTPAPEPSGFVQLAAGLFVLGGLALAGRKRSSVDAQ